MFSGAHAHGPVWLPGARPRTHNKNQTRWIFIICCLVIDGEVVLKASWWPDPGAPCVPCCRRQARFSSLLKREKRETRAESQRNKNWRKGPERKKIASALLLYFIHLCLWIEVSTEIFMSNLTSTVYQSWIATADCFMGHGWLSKIKL